MKTYKVCLVGVSGIGKSSIINVLVDEYNFAFSVSTTTRLQRPGEIDGIHYDFISRSEFEHMIEKDLFIEHTLYADNYYGTPLVQLSKHEGKHVVFDLDPDKTSFEKPGMKNVVRCLLEHDDKEIIKQRLRNRFAEGDKNVSLQIRLDQIDNRIYDKTQYHFHINVTNKTPQEIAAELMTYLIKYDI